MKKELLTVEFRYHVVPKSDYDSTCENKTITIGVYDTLEEAVIAGNKILPILKRDFDINDNFSTTGFFGTPTKLVCSWNSKVSVFAKIETLHYDDLEETIKEAKKQQMKYDRWHKQ